MNRAFNLSAKNILLSTSIAVAFSLLCSGTANAEWSVYRNEQNSDSDVLFIDWQSFRVNQNIRKAWFLWNKKLPNDIKSDRRLLEIDCRNEQIRTIAFYQFTERMAEGSVKYKNEKADEWTPLIPESMARLIADDLCAKTKERR